MENFGYKVNRSVTVTHTKYFNQRLLNYTQHFSSCADYNFLCTLCYTTTQVHIGSTTIFHVVFTFDVFFTNQTIVTEALSENLSKNDPAQNIDDNLDPDKATYKDPKSIPDILQKLDLSTDQ